MTRTIEDIIRSTGGLPVTTEEADTMTQDKITERAERLVRQEVHMCLSSLVSTLAQSSALVEQRSGHWVHRREVKERVEALMSLQEQAFELSTPVLDYEEAARQAGWRYEPCCWCRPDPDGDGGYMACTEAEEACRVDNLDPYEWEIFEHWAVSEWFGRQLAAQGERVDFDFANMVVWGRTTTGQGIANDSVVLKIAAELNKEIV